jgi:hypothetical protein
MKLPVPAGERTAISRWRASPLKAPMPKSMREVTRPSTTPTLLNDWVEPIWFPPVEESKRRNWRSAVPLTVAPESWSLPW